jgi:hypothetical protein
MKAIVLAAVLFASAATCSGPTSSTRQQIDAGANPPTHDVAADNIGATRAAGALRYCPPGDLLGPGEAGYTGRRVFFPEITFPIDFQPDTYMISANSQMYNSGGYCFGGTCGGQGGGSSCVRNNFTQAWRDTFCEEAGRSYDTPMCPDGKGHQGVDVRPPVTISGDGEVCRRNFWTAVAFVDGKVTRASGAVVTIVDPAGRRFTYRHMNPSSIREFGIGRNDNIRRGQPLGRVDQYNNSGTERYTTLHLHIEALSQAPNGATLFFPLYTSLIAAYRQSVGLSPLVDGAGELRLDRRLEMHNGCRT